MAFCTRDSTVLFILFGSVATAFAFDTAKQEEEEEFDLQWQAV